MATKIKKAPTKKATSPKPVKDPSVGLPVRKLMERIQTEFKRELVSTNIPAFTTIAQDKDLVAHFFLNRNLYLELLGGNIALFDRVMRSSFATVLTKDMVASIVDNENATYPGLWDEFHIKSLMITCINVVTLADDPGSGFYLSVRRHPNAPTADDVKDYAPSSWMPFRDYHPNRLYQVLYAIHQTVLATIVNEISSNVPAATFSASGEPVTVRYGRQFGELMYNPLQDKDVAGLDIEDYAKSFISKLERPLFTYMTALLAEAGFNVDIVGRYLDKAHAAVTYTTKNRSGKEATGFIHPWVKLSYSLISEDGSAAATCELCPNDVVIAANTMEHPNKGVDETTGEETVLPPTLTAAERNACNRLGKSILAFLDSLSAFMINLAIKEQNARVKAEIEALNAVQSEDAGD